MACFYSLLIQLVVATYIINPINSQDLHANRSGDFLSQLNILCVANGQQFDAHHLPQGF